MAKKCKVCGRKDCTRWDHRDSRKLYDDGRYNWAEDTKKKREKWEQGKGGDE